MLAGTMERLTPGTVITEMRERAGYTKRELAKAIGAEEHTIGRWENGSRSPRMSDFEKILRACDAEMVIIYF